LALLRYQVTFFVRSDHIRNMPFIGQITQGEGKAGVAVRAQGCSLEMRTLHGPACRPGKTRLAADRPEEPFQPVLRDRPGDGVFGLNNPTFSSLPA
jgi:hypothetical protein